MTIGIRAEDKNKWERRAPLAPEHVFPAAIEDALRAYRWLLAEGVDASRIAIGGDSAGAGIALASQMRIRDAGEPLPACSILLSPWTDLEMTGDSSQPGNTDDPLLTASLLSNWLVRSSAKLAKFMLSVRR